MRKRKPTKSTRRWHLPWKPLFVGSCLIAILFSELCWDPLGWFRLQRIQVVGASKRVPEAVILKRVALPLGQSLLALDLEKVQQQLIGLTWVQRANLRRLLPDTLSIHIEEHIPVALLALPKLYLVGSTGIVFKPLEPRDPQNLPVITGLSRQESGSPNFGDEGGSLQRRIRESLEIITTIQATEALHPYGLSELHWNDDESIHLITRQDPFTIALGQRPWRWKLDQLIQVFPHLYKEGKKPKLVTLEPNKGIVVRYQKN